MQDNSKKSSTIAKNAIMLYIRMAFTMFISLYTSRIVLNALGVDDFGISNVVGGIIGFFGFIIYSMQTAVQRFLTVALGKGDLVEVQHVFSVGIFIHAVISLFVFVLGETVGLWFLENKLVIPAERMDAAFWVYQFCIIGTITSLMSIPYTAEVIAHEKMGTFAFLSILNVLLSFGVAELLLATPFDRLITYSFLGLVISLLNRFLYTIYCKRKFKECRFTMKFPRQLLKDMSSFAGWDFFGVIAYCVSTQGATIMLNLFFGPSVNAARAVAQTALEKVKSFSINFTTALNPAITKSYGEGNFDYMNKLMYSGSKLVFCLILMLELPALVKTHYLLELWLKNVPEYSVEFVQILIVQSIFLTMWNPLFVGGLATGNIKEFGLKTSISNILKMPICYLFLVWGASPVQFILAYTILELLAYSIQLFAMRKLLGFDFFDYFKEVLGKGILIMLIATPIALVVSSAMPENFITLIVVGVVTTIMTILLCYFYLLNRLERSLVVNKSKAVIGKVSFFNKNR